MSEARIDKWLWAVRIYKTRTIAADACKNSRVRINDAVVKPSRMVKVGDTVSVRKPPITYTFRVKQAIENRVGARFVPDMLENITPPEQYDILEMSRISGFVNRARGMGRPTKKERRDLDDFTNPADYYDSFMDDDETDDFLLDLDTEEISLP
ncbi:MAG: RNA-binding S4 domain-containing protein [Alloprevotella sp.]|nr:RNA-binding S4 domain-containing protein [Alloprevotella sp.]